MKTKNGKVKVPAQVLIQCKTMWCALLNSMFHKGALKKFHGFED